ncbi:MAG: hypothetical protein GVY13_11850 [Alphaproteobacteria bacterium]|jgi:hypothetical protein|nr:hypothetical protein [Alphaproteobacteria bacterium]
MPTIETQAGDISRTLKEQGVADDETVFVSYQRSEDRRPCVKRLKKCKAPPRKPGLPIRILWTFLKSMNRSLRTSLTTRLPSKLCVFKDDVFLAVALAGKADALVTGDRDLLVLHPFRGIPILSPRAFLDVMTSPR